jgi:hypothetical protein
MGIRVTTSYIYDTIEHSFSNFHFMLRKHVISYFVYIKGASPLEINNHILTHNTALPLFLQHFMG